MHTRKGFTLIEILVVITIIGILVGMISVGLSGARARGQDTRRVTDLKQLQNGLENYHAKYNQYPITLGELLTGAIGVDKLPKDPVSQADYFYSYLTANREGYVLAARLNADSNAVIYNDSNQGVVLSNYSGNVPSCAPQYYCVSF